jgi:hypothetical protein
MAWQRPSVCIGADPLEFRQARAAIVAGMQRFADAI